MGGQDLYSQAIQRIIILLHDNYILVRNKFQYWMRNAIMILLQCKIIHWCQHMLVGSDGLVFPFVLSSLTCISIGKFTFNVKSILKKASLHVISYLSKEKNVCTKNKIGLHGLPVVLFNSNWELVETTLFWCGFFTGDVSRYQCWTCDKLFNKQYLFQFFGVLFQKLFQNIIET